MDTHWSIEELLQLYLAGYLPEEVTLVVVPIEQAAYGDYRVVADSVGKCAKSGPGHTGLAETAEGAEHVELSWYEIGGRRFFAGYGGLTRTLVVGTDR